MVVQPHRKAFNCEITLSILSWINTVIDYVAKDWHRITKNTDHIMSLIVLKYNLKYKKSILDKHWPKFVEPSSPSPWPSTFLSDVSEFSFLTTLLRTCISA